MILVHGGDNMKEYNKMHTRNKPTISIMDEQITTTADKINPPKISSKAIVVATKLNIRKSQDKNSEVLGVLNKDTIIELHSNQNVDSEWAYIHTNNISGYVMRIYIKEVTELDLHE
jgi:hypothetical protein